MVKYGHEKRKAVEKALALDSDEGRMKAIKLWHSYEGEKAAAPITSYPAKQVRDGQVLMQDGDKCYRLRLRQEKGRFTWECHANNCKASYTGFPLTDGSFYGWLRSAHTTHGSAGYECKYYNESSGRLSTLDRLVALRKEKKEDMAEFKAYESALFKLESATGEADAPKDAIIYIKLGGELKSGEKWETIDILNGTEYIGETTQPLTRRMSQHSHRDKNLFPFTESGEIFCVIGIRVNKKARFLWEILFLRLFVYSSRLLNEKMGPLELQGLSLDEMMMMGSALKFVKAISYGDVHECDWTKKVAAAKREQAPGAQSDNSSLDETDPLYDDYALLKAEEAEKEEELKAIREKKRQLKRTSSELRHASKRRRMEENDERQ